METSNPNEIRTVHKYIDPTPGAWRRFMDAFQSGEELEIDEEMWYYWLEVLPPVFMNKAVPFPDPQRPTKYAFGFAEGAEPITVFWCSPDRTRFFCRRSNIMNHC